MAEKYPLLTTRLQSSYRFTQPIKLLLGAISFLTISSNPKRRAIHDFMSGSVMKEL
jgi:hypothetical protein